MMCLFAGSFFLYLGIGFFLGLSYVSVRYGIPLFLGFVALFIEALRQILLGLWTGLRGKPPPQSRL